MQRIHINPTKETPEVLLDKDESNFIISGVSLPEDIKEFYIPVVNWFKEYFKSPNDMTSLKIKLIYFNSASSKMFFEIFQLFKRAFNEGHKVEVIWQYILDDDEMGEAGEDFAILFGSLPFKVVGSDYNS